MMYMTPGIEMETIFGDGSGTQQGRLHGRAARRRQAPADRRDPVHDGVHQHRRRASQTVAFAAPYPGPHPGDGPQEARRRADLPEGLVPLRGQGRLDRHRVPEEDRRRPVRRRGLHHAAPAGRRPRLRPRRRHAARAASSKPGETLRVDTGCLVALQPSVNYDIQFVGGSRPRSSAARACSSPRSPAPATSGCSRCRSAAWPTASPRRIPGVIRRSAGAKKASRATYGGRLGQT